MRYASLSNAGYEPDGGKKTNQDSFVSILEFGDPSVSVFGVFDGHGGTFTHTYTHTHTHTHTHVGIWRL